MLFLVFYITMACLAAPVIGVVLVRAVSGGGSPSNDDYAFGAMLGMIAAIVWPLAIAAGVMYLIVKWLYRRVVQLEREMEELRRR